MFATIQDLYTRFGKANVLRVANFDAVDEYGADADASIEPRLIYFLEQAYEFICDALRQGTYDPDSVTEPYPQTLVNLNCEVAFIKIYRTKHSDDETVSDAYRVLEEDCNRLIRDIRSGNVRFRSGIRRAMSIPANVNASLMGAKRRPNVAGTPPGQCDHRFATDEEISEVFNRIFNNE